jgi:hypothetical protein
MIRESKIFIFSQPTRIFDKKNFLRSEQEIFTNKILEVLVTENQRKAKECCSQIVTYNTKLVFLIANMRK